MIKSKFKLLICVIALFLVNTPLNTFAEAINESTTSIITKKAATQTPNPESGNTTLDGEIGEWDPTLDDNPNFDEVDEVEGKKPIEGEYFTISVTVPIEMEFFVFPNNQLAFGNFFSPEYTIKNNGTKEISAKIKEFNMTNSLESETNTPLYIERAIGGDRKTQMELNMCATENLDEHGRPKEVSLINLQGLSDEKRTLYNLKANEFRKVKFSSKRWELPQFESKKETASSSYTAGFEFSIIANE